MENKKVLMGLDLGTNSCGWAVTDEKYNLLKYHGKSLWGVRLFEDGETAADRRLKRSNRRRLNRKKWRIDLLQDLFSDEIYKVDPNFFLRLNNSFYQEDDKKNLGKYSLFNDKVYTDKAYFKDYPTIFHLRSSLMNIHTAPDIRLIYLAIHHIVKYRGHFLLEGSNFSFSTGDSQYIKELFAGLESSIEEYIEENLNMTFLIDDNVSEFIKIATENYSPKRLSEKLNTLLNPSNNKFAKSIINLISGLTVQSKDIFMNNTDEYGDLTKIVFSDDKYENDIEPQLFEVFSDGANVIIEAKKIYDWIVLIKLLGNNTTISEAMKNLYNKHGNDLFILKKVYKSHFSKEEYSLMFRSSSALNNYCAYVKTNQVNNIKTYTKGCKREDFTKALKKKLESIPESDRDESVQYILNEITQDSFLPKLSTKSNASIPYQLHYHELEEILANNSKFFPFFDIKDSTGYSFSEKIKMLMKFRIPYYVGPLNDYHKNHNHGHAWVVRNENGPVLPWNYSVKINEKESQKAFILRMTNKCTYLKGKDVLPKYSLLYSEFSLLNEINKLQINGNYISTPLKNTIINGLFKKKKKVTIHSMVQFLVKEGIVSKSTDIKIVGLDEEIKSSLASYIDFTNIFGSITYNNKAMIEKIIFYITLFEDKNALRNVLFDEFHLSKEVINQLIRLPYSGFGRLSREFIESEVVHIDEDGVPTSIISLMRENNLTMMEALNHPRYHFLERIDEINQGINQNDKPTYQSLIEPLNCSPSIKRSIWQATKIVKEIKKTINKPIDCFFVEVAREKQESKRTISRRTLIAKYLASAKAFKEEYDKLNNELNRFSDSHLRSDKLFLYFLQLGRCAYSNDPIDIDQLASGLYDIDHIIPRSFLKDDSIDNRVLVKSELNKIKGDNYPLCASWQAKMDSFWRKLVECNLMSDKKYARLSRKTELAENEIGDFINRQLVFTNQSVKALIDVLKVISPESEIVYSKAGNVSDFRRDFDLLKCREINDFHHAHDAYLNVVVGNVYHVKYGFDARKVVQEYRKNKEGISTQRLFQRPVRGVWDPATSISVIKNMLNRWDPLVTKMTYEKKGKLYDETIYPKNSDLFPVKENVNNPLSNPSKYGGYKGLKNAYFVIVESLDKKGKKMITIESIPVIYAKRIESDSSFLLNLLSINYGLINPLILVNKLKINTLVRINNTEVNITGKSDSSCLVQSATQMFANEIISDYVRLIVKHRKMVSKIDEIQSFEDDSFVISESMNDNKPDLKLSKEMNLVIFDFIVSQLKKPLYEYLTVSSTVNKIQESRNAFIDSNIRIQAYVLYELLHFIQTNASKSNLSLIMEKASNLGTNRINKNITDLPIQIIDQSVTGIYSHVRWTNTNGI